MTHYLFDDFGRFIGTSDVATSNSTTVKPDVLDKDSNWNGYSWVIVPGIAPITAGSAMTMPTQVIYQKIGPIAFQMLFTLAEMSAANKLKSTDSVLASFWKLIDDPRTDVVDLSLESVQNAVEYTLVAAKNAGVDVDVPARKAAILSGVLK